MKLKETAARKVVSFEHESVGAMAFSTHTLLQRATSNWIYLF